ncbi:MAG: hypothetical protein ACLUEK_01860 [Oscillospiraceae bacterium]
MVKHIMPNLMSVLVQITLAAAYHHRGVAQLHGPGVEGAERELAPAPGATTTSPRAG